MCIIFMKHNCDYRRCLFVYADCRHKTVENFLKRHFDALKDHIIIFNFCRQMSTRNNPLLHIPRLHKMGRQPDQALKTASFVFIVVIEYRHLLRKV